MKADEFLRNGATPKRQSKLQPFRADLFKLQATNLSLEKMVEFLAINGVTATRSTVSRFLAARQGRGLTDPPPNTGRRVSEPEPVTERGESDSQPATDAPGSKRLSAKERHAIAEREAAKFFPNRFAKEPGDECPK